MQKQPKVMATAALFSAALIWGCGFIAMDFALAAGWNPTQIMSGRFVIASLVMLVFVFRKLGLSTKRELLSGVIAGVLLFLSFFLQTVGQSQTTVSNTAFFTSTNIVFVPFLSWPLLKKKPRNGTIFFTFLSLAGMSVLSYQGGTFSLNFGDLLVLLCALTFALHIVFLEKVGRRTDSARVNFFQITTAAFLSLVALAINHEPLPDFSFSEGFLPVVFLGVFSTSLCYFLQTSAQRHVSATTAAVILSLESLVAAILSVTLGIDPLTASLVIGGTLIVSATLLINREESKRIGLDS